MPTARHSHCEYLSLRGHPVIPISSERDTASEERRFADSILPRKKLKALSAPFPASAAAAHLILIHKANFYPEPTNERTRLAR